MKYKLQKTLLLLSLILLTSGTMTKAQTARTDWFEHDRFGMFIHWGLYSAAEGTWKGEQLRNSNNYAEWIRYRNRISKEEYGSLAKRFVWDRINPEEWVLLAKKAGMKYIVMTTKHHDGVALWDTKVGSYSLPKLSGSNRDVIREIADACRKHNMKLGFYYSHWIDWEHPYAWDHNQELSGRVSDAQYNQYWQEKVIPQLRELLTNYGDIALIWFDMWIPYQKSIVKKEQLEQVGTLIRKLQPNCLINSRLGLPTENKAVDFESLGDNGFGSHYVDHPWETPGTIAHSWGYNGQEKEWKSSGQLFKSLIGNVVFNGGFTLNIGPRADGSVPYESVSRLEDIGKWMHKYGESIYNNTGLQFPNRHDWGEVTRRKNSNTVYFHIFNWPLDRILRVTGITSKPQKIELLYGDKTEPLLFSQYGPLLHINLPQEQSDPHVTVVRVTYENIDLDTKVVKESTFGGFSLNGLNAINAENLDQVAPSKVNPSFTSLKDEQVSWEVFIHEPGNYSVDLSVHNPTKEQIPVSLRLENQEINSEIGPTGKVVVEPNNNDYTEEFVDRRVNELKITKPGRYTISFTKKGKEILWLNRIWINKI
ncbi:MAG: alpha-L-fucosidase [Sphingobacterium sp.]|nr:alpha-L-fucosidase [Sphingobacterium sp.]